MQEWEGIPIYNYGYVNETKEVAVTVRDLPDNMKFFSEITGIKYPYAKYSQAFVEDFGGGMENISATTMIEEMIHDEREMLDEDSNSLQAHELAHQWFGDLVTCRDWGQIWLNESFATYLDALYHQHSKGHDDFLYNNVRGNQLQMLGAWAAGNRRPIVTKHYENKDAMFDIYSYPGGAAVLHILRKHLGDKLFYKSLNHYLVTNMNQPVSTEDLRIAIEEASGQSMDWFFDQWLYRMGHPVFEVTQSHDEAAKKLTLNVKQTQKIDVTNEFPQVAFFQGFVDIAMDGRVERVWLKPQAENVFVLDAPTKPRIVNFDHEGTWIKAIKFEKTVDELLYQLKEDKDILGRRWALGELAGQVSNEADKPRIFAAFLASAEKDASWRMRQAALAEITRVLSPDPPEGQEATSIKLAPDVEAVVLRMTKDANSLVRADAIALLAQTVDAKHANLYRAALNDRSYAVIDQAAIALAWTKDKKAYDALMKLTTTPSWKGRIQIAGLSGLASLGDARAFDTGFKMATDMTLSPNVRSAAFYVVGSTGKGNQKAFPFVFERFKKALDSNDFVGLQTAITAITGIGDPRGQEAFDMLKAKYKDQSTLLAYIALLELQFKESLKP